MDISGWLLLVLNFRAQPIKDLERTSAGLSHQGGIFRVEPLDQGYSYLNQTFP